MTDIFRFSNNLVVFANLLIWGVCFSLTSCGVHEYSSSNYGGLVIPILGVLATFMCKICDLYTLKEGVNSFKQLTVNGDISAPLVLAALSNPAQPAPQVHSDPDHPAPVVQPQPESRAQAQ